jgi:colanic acid/amylovoran biosynthesis glycosyltransferase
MPPSDAPAGASEPSSPPACSVAYLVSQYPTLSMTFVLREVMQLRRMGFRISVASVNQPDRTPEKMTAEEISEAAQTYHLKKHGLTGAVLAHCRAVLRHPGGYLKGVRLWMRLGGLDLKGLALNLMYFTEALMVGVWMEKEGQRHLHVHLGSQAATVGLYVKTVFGVGYSITVHGPDEFYDAEGQHLSEKIAAADFICCISFFARSQLMRFSPYSCWSKLVVCRLGVDPSLFVPRPPPPRSDAFEILCVGRLTPSKAQHILIGAVEQLSLQGRRVRLRLVGSGADEPALREHASKLPAADSVVFEGAVNQDRIRALYRMAHVFCIPSVAEGIPVVLMEAMAMEIPCITTWITGIPELIRDGVDGLLVAPSDLDGLVGGLVRLMDDAELRERLSKSGRGRVVEQYDLQRSVEEFAAILRTRIVA